MELKKNDEEIKKIYEEYYIKQEKTLKEISEIFSLGSEYFQVNFKRLHLKCRTRIEAQKILTRKKYLGNKYKTNQGYEVTVIDIEDAENVTIQFEDGTIRKKIKVNCLKTGCIQYPPCPRNWTKQKFENILNETSINKQGHLMKIKTYRNAHDIDIEFPFLACVAEHKDYLNFRKGCIVHPIIGPITEKEYNNRMTKIISHSNGHTSRIKEYRGAHDIDVVFEDGAIVKNVTYHSFINGIGHPIDGGLWNTPYETFINDRYINYRNGAVDRGYEFNLSKEEFEDIITKPCVYCGSKHSMVFHVGKKNSGRDYYYNGIDRVDNNKGYTINNVVSCCSICNRGKSTLKLKDWLSYLNQLCEFRKTA